MSVTFQNGHPVFRPRIFLIISGLAATIAGVFFFVYYMNGGPPPVKLAPIIDCNKTPCRTNQLPRPDVRVWDEQMYSPAKRSAFAVQINQQFPRLSASVFEKPVPMLVLRIQAVFPYTQEDVHLYADKIICNRWWYKGPQEDLGVTPEDVRAYGFQLVQFEDMTGSAATCETTAPINTRPQFVPQ